MIHVVEWDKFYCCCNLFLILSFKVCLFHKLKIYFWKFKHKNIKSYQTLLSNNIFCSNISVNVILKNSMLYFQTNVLIACFIVVLTAGHRNGLVNLYKDMEPFEENDDIQVMWKMIQVQSSTPQCTCTVKRTNRCLLETMFSTDLKF